MLDAKLVAQCDRLGEKGWSVVEFGWIRPIVSSPGVYFYCWFISYNIHVTDLILNAISFGLLLLWSALAVKCETSHLSHFSQNESLVLNYTLFTRCKTQC